MTEIFLTKKAAEHFANVLQEEDSAVGVRIGVKTSGCSGKAYTVDIATAIQPEELSFSQYGVTLVIAPDSMPYLAGMTIDWVTEGVNSFLQFKNPNVVAECGCGESFQVGENSNKEKTKADE